MTINRTGRVDIERIPYDPVVWETAIAGHPDLDVFHGSTWLDYLALSQGAEPVVAIVRADGHPVGYFAGAIVRRYGIRILGSPLRGWTTQRMGFLLEPGFDRRRAADALLPFAFSDLRCAHVELTDRHLTAESMAGSGYAVETGRTFVVDLGRPEDEIVAGMHQKTRQYLRKGLRAGLTVDVASGHDFADDFYAQLVEVFAHQGLVPTYGIERVRQLITALQPSGQLLLLRVLTPEGRCVASGLAIGRNGRAVHWGAAFFRADSGLHPNEVMWWESMRLWRSRGVVMYDMGGGGEYKSKYGGVETPVFVFHRSRHAILRRGRSAVRGIVRARQVLAGRRVARRPAGRSAAE